MSSMRLTNLARTRCLSSLPPDKPFYVTTPIFYVNSYPHIGHLYSMYLADTIKRWASLQGRRAILCTGTDEHGSKVAAAAAAAGIAVDALAARNAKRFQNLAERAGISQDVFIRTTSTQHKEAVRAFWKLLVENGHVYKDRYAGWYSISDEAFYDENETVKSIEPTTGRSIRVAKSSGSEVDWLEETTYKFRLTAFRDRLLKFYHNNPDWIIPRERQEEVIAWVDSHLTDLSISRPANRVSWGVRVPGDNEHTIYIWVDALVNYLTAVQYPDWPKGKDMYMSGWPAELHVIGKDIVRFHCVYWPALLMAAKLLIPGRILVHSHWTMGGKKMSKSLGNVVDPFDALARWSPDALRYFMLSQGCINNDSDYNNQTITVKYKKDLQGGIGNLLARVTRTSRWNLPDAVRIIGREVGQTPLSEIFSFYNIPFKNKSEQLQTDSGIVIDGSLVKEHIENQLTILRMLTNSVSAKMALHDPVEALRKIQSVVTEANVFFTATKPWDLARLENSELLIRTIYTMGETLRIIGILLQPFLPTKATALLNELGVSVNKRTLNDAQLGLDFTYGQPMDERGNLILDKSKLRKSAWESLFPKLALEEMSVDDHIRQTEQAQEIKKIKKAQKTQKYLIHGIKQVPRIS